VNDLGAVHIAMIVIYSTQLERCKYFYSNLGITFTVEQHEQGPRHYAAVLVGGTVFELYPGRSDRQTGALRLGFTINGVLATPALASGCHLFEDPDGRIVEIQAV